MTAPTDNGTAPRKTLAQQIDRLDGILDGLDAALHGAVADAVREAVGPIVLEAVQLAVAETLSSPEAIRAALKQSPALSRPVTLPLRRRAPSAAVNGACLGPLDEAIQAAIESSRDLRRASLWALSQCRRGCDLALAGWGCFATFCFGVSDDRAPS
jgi:hypothetical protein